MAKEDKANIYLVAIVGIVGAVGILVMLMNAGIGSSSNSDWSGQAIAGSATLSGSSLIDLGDTSTIGSSKGGGRKDCGDCKAGDPKSCDADHYCGWGSSDGCRHCLKKSK